MPFPNTFLIGAQKSGSTTLFNWIAQHPDVYGNLGFKDYPFFIKDQYYKKGIIYLSDLISKEYNNEQIILTGCVEYINYEKAIKRIHDCFPNAKYILILRNPLERLISAYNVARLRNRDSEKDILKASVDKRIARSCSDDYSDKSMMSYIDHGLYSEKIEMLFRYFRKDQLFICFFKDLKEDPERLIKELYSFLGLSDEFTPKFKVLNKTGKKLKSMCLEKMLFKNISLQSKTRRFFIGKIIDKILPINLRNKIKWRVREWNSIKTDDSELVVKVTKEEKHELLSYFIDDIEKLEEMLEIKLDHWKRIN